VPAATPLAIRRDRTTRLVAFGILAILVGVGATAIGLVQLAIALIPRGGALASDPRSALAGAVIQLALGGAFFIAGTGSIRCRRWAPPILRVLAWSWLVGGLLTLPLVPHTIEQALGGMPEMVLGAQVMALGVTVFFGVVMPLAFAWAYRGDDIERTCRDHQPQPSWTDGRPASVLGLSLGFGAFAVILLVQLLRPAAPLFGALVVGLPGAGLLVAAAALSAWLAVSTHRRRKRAWWIALAFLVLMGISTAATLARVSLARWYAALGQPPDVLPEDSGFRFLLVASTALVTAASAVYMVAVRRHFDT
jgi:hypothetical protein